MDAVFLKLLNMSITASWLILAVIPVRLLLKKAPKWTACLLWLLVAVALVIPVRFESSASLIPDSEPISVENTAGSTQNTDDAPSAAPTQPATDTTNMEPMLSQPRQTIQIGSWVWLGGMAVMLLCAAVSWLRLRRRVAASIQTSPGSFICDDINSPFILGILRPRIYLPSALDNDAAAQVLAHERAHLARKDHWWKPLGYLLLTLHWFNPLVWVAYALLCRDIELACDEKVIRHMDDHSKKQYLEVLLRCSIPRYMVAACPLAFGEVGIKQRIKAVLHYKRPTFWVIAIAIVVCIALCFGFLTDPISDNGNTANQSSGDNAKIKQLETTIRQSEEQESELETLKELSDKLSRLDDSISCAELKTAIEDALNGTNIDYSQAELSSDFYRSDRFECTALNVDYITADGTVRNDDPITVHLTYADGKFTADSFSPEEDIAAFLLTDEPVCVCVCPSANTTINVSLLVSLNPDTGEILSLCSFPSEMHSSFIGYEDLYTTIRTHSQLHTWSDLILVAATEYKGSSYAVVRYSEDRQTKAALLEYRTDPNGTQLLTFSRTEEPNSSYGLWKTGFYMNSASMSEHYIYWSVIADSRIATSPDGTKSDHTAQVETDFTAMRFIFQDLSYVDVPITDDLFITELEGPGVTPPRICVPIANDTLLSALGMPEPGAQQSTHFS